MKFKSLLLRQRAASDFRLRRVFSLTRRGVSAGALPCWTTGEKEAPGPLSLRWSNTAELPLKLPAGSTKKRAASGNRLRRVGAEGGI